MKINLGFLTLLMVINVCICQTFNPETGELLSDSTQTIRFDPVTGLPVESSPKHIIVQQSAPIPTSEIIYRAEFEARQEFNSLPWKLLGAPVVGLSLLVGGISAAMLDDIADQGFVGFLGGTGLTALMVPDAMSKISTGLPVSAIISAEKSYPNLENRTIYLESYQQEVEHLRRSSIFKGELLTVGGFFGFIFILII